MAGTKHRFRTFALAVITNALISVALLLIAEFAARYWVLHMADDHQFSQFAPPAVVEKRGPHRVPYAPHPYLGYYLRPGFAKGNMQFNSQGYRGPEIATPKPDGEFRIVCLGGSTTFGDGIEDNAHTFPAQLERILKEQGHNVSVINAGTPAWASYEYFINYAFRVSYLDADLVMLPDSYNDVSARMVRPESYKSDNTGAKEVYLFDHPWYEHFYLGRMFSVSVLGQFSQMDMVLFRYSENQLHYATDPYFEGHSLSELLAENPPDFYMDNFKSLATMIRNDGAMLVLATGPYHMAPEAIADSFEPLGDIDMAIAASELTRALDEMNDRTRELAQTLRAPLIDLAASFPRPADYREYYFDCVHMNEEGCLIKARQVADFLTSNNLLLEVAGKGPAH